MESNSVELAGRGVDWNGEGVPPVGAICEWRLKFERQYAKAEVIFVTDKSIVLRRSDGHEWVLEVARCNFRLPPTVEEIIATEQAKQEIIELTEILGKGKLALMSVFQLASFLHDNGVRKITRIGVVKDEQ